MKNSQGRRGSWLGSLGSKLSSSSPGNATPRSGSVDSSPSAAKSGQKSPKVEFGNPFDQTNAPKEVKQATTEQRPVLTHPPRRQSVLVHAGQERKDSSPGFLQSALRRLSSSNAATLGKAANSGAMCPRKVMNVDPNRDRVKIAGFDARDLKRVAFCVDVEIAGYSQQQDEDDDKSAPTVQQTQSLAMLELQAQNKNKRDSKEAKYKEKGEGAALKNPRAATEEKEETGATREDAIQATEARKQSSKEERPPDATSTDAATEPPTKKKEKKKRSEAERKERKEKKKKLAQANGEVPLELSADSDSNGSNGTSTPNASDQPTTDPLRIYKRCCQLRETSAIKRVMDQISKPSKTLAETSGTVGMLDLSGAQIPLADITTLGDWLAVVPVRRLALDDCGLTDEGVRILLSGLVGCKTTAQAKQNKQLSRAGSGKRGEEQLGVIEKLSLKNNQFTALGWKHIALFLHISKSIRAVDLSGNDFPQNGDLSRTSTASSNVSTLNGASKTSDVGELFLKALTQKYGDKLEELLITSCALNTSNIKDIVDCAVKCRIKRLGLADNNITQEGLQYVAQFMKTGYCEALDLGSNDLHDRLKVVADNIDPAAPLFALSLSDCNLTTSDLETLLPSFTKLTNFRFIDVSHNQQLFSSEPNAVAVLRRYLPKMNSLRRVHLVDVGLSSEQVIALAETLPDCAHLAHISILDNPRLVQMMNSKEGSSQEEACAFFVSLMTAARVSRTMVAIEVEVPGADTSEVVRALASQVVAYTLRNLEKGAMDEYGIDTTNVHPDKEAPEVLLHLVGHMEGYDENHDNDDPAPDEDYMIASTGIVKALGVCLGTKDPSRSASRNITPTASGTATPRHGMPAIPVRSDSYRKPRNVSLQLCESARKIRMRLRPALVKEDQAGNDLAYSMHAPSLGWLGTHTYTERLQFLDSTLERIIQRFEDEYPETRVEPLPSPPDRRNEFAFDPPPGISSLGSSLADASVLSGSTGSNSLSKVLSSEEIIDNDADEANEHALHLARTASGSSLAARAQAQEEGEMHRFGQKFRREILRPSGTLDYAHGTTTEDEPEPAHKAKLRAKIEEFSGEHWREQILAKGVDQIMAELGTSMEELRSLEVEDLEGFRLFKEARENASLNTQQDDVNGLVAGSGGPSIYA